MGKEPLREALSTPERKRRYVARLFDTIADDYDFITRLLSYGRDQHWKRRLIALAAVQPHERVLDLACGTGDLAFAAAEAGAQSGTAAESVALAGAAGAGRASTQTRSMTQAAVGGVGPAVSMVPGAAPLVIGLDVTPRMVHLARARAGERGGVAAARTRLLVGDMMSLPFASASIDVITTGYGFRNVPVLDEAIRETCRVLRPGGRLFSLDFNRPQPAALRGLYLAYLTVVGSAVGLALHRDPDTYRYIPESIRRYPGAAAVVDRLRTAGFREARWIPVLGGLMAIHVARK